MNPSSGLSWLILSLVLEGCTEPAPKEDLDLPRHDTDPPAPTTDPPTDDTEPPVETDPPIDSGLPIDTGSQVDTGSPSDSGPPGSPPIDTDPPAGTVLIEAPPPGPSYMPNPDTCPNPNPIGSGEFVTCPDGSVNRVTSASLPILALPSCQGNEDERSCSTDDDCVSGPHGQCARSSYYDPDRGQSIDTCGCEYSCQTDADCPDGACTMVNGHGTCLYSECRTSADCPSGECGLSEWYDGCGIDVSLLCRSELDTCRSDQECAPGTSCSVAWWVDPSAFACNAPGCEIGRPLRASGAPLVARDTGGEAWCAGREVGVGHAEAAGRWWAEVAAFEHASVASFGRFLLQLIRLGAPPDLLTRAAEAAADEVRHASAAYAIAATLLGRPVSPGPLAVEQADEVWSLEGVLAEVIMEGCVGESLAATEAAEALLHAQDPAIRAALEAVAREEARHAALAWRTARWILQQEPALQPFAERALREAAARAAEVVPGVADAAPWGVLSSAARTAVRRRALAEILPRLAKVVLAIDGLSLPPAGPDSRQDLPTAVPTTWPA